MAIAIVIAALLAGAFVSMSYYMQQSSDRLKYENSKIILEVVRSRLLHLATPANNHSCFDLPAHETDNTLPLNVGISTDAWGQELYYEALQDCTTAQTIGPNDNVVARIISKGSSGTMHTDDTDTKASGDDLMIEIGIGELNHFKLYGGSEIAEETRNYHSAIFSNQAPNNPTTGTLWYNTDDDNLTIYDGDEWRGL